MLKRGVSSGDGALLAVSGVALNHSKEQRVNFLMVPTWRQKSKAAAVLFFLEESFSIFILKCNYRLLNGRRRPICTHVIFH